MPVETPISICIISKGRENQLREMLDLLKTITKDYANAEIVVIEETENPKPIPGVYYISIPVENKGYSFARNLAVENASNEIIVFLDDDCQPEENWLAELTGPLLEEELTAGCAGAVKVKDTNITGLCENVLGFPGGGLKYIHFSHGEKMRTHFLSTLNCAYKKSAVLEMGGFDERAKYGSEDYLLAKKVSHKYQCVYNPKAVVYHEPRSTLWNNFMWFVRRGISDAKLTGLVENPSRHIKNIMKSSVVLKLIFLFVLLRLLSFSYVWAICFPLVLYYFYNLYFYRYSWCYFKSLRVLFYTPIVKIAMDLGMDWGRIISVTK